MSIATLFGIIAAVLLGAVLLAALIFLSTKLFGLTYLILRNIFRFIGEEITDTLRVVGAVLASVLFAPLVVLSILVGRWSASKHYAGALINEIRAGTRSVYRIGIGNIARLFGVSKALEGVEQRVPNVMAAAPTRDQPTKRTGIFEGYTIVGSLKGGGSGGKLYIAEPDEVKQAVFAKRKLGEVDQVVIKVFSLKDGSSLPQIVRESRALDAARSLGLVLEHEMATERFFYVMRYVPGESLSLITQRMHSLCPSEGLDTAHLRSMMGFGEDLLVALDTYHHAELWHKDVKPDNIIIDGHGSGAKAHLVDFGLITPMRSAMTLTTHGTEYFRDPELVRQALRGVKVHQIDGSKFDVYAAGAVLFSMIENSFPAHGGLSQLTKRCPEALRWIVRRAMAEYDRRYPSAAAMLADLRVVMGSDDPFKVKPIDLPSVSQGDVAAADQVEHERVAAFDEPVSVGGSPVPPRVGRVVDAPERGARVGRPRARLTSWWSGKYNSSGEQRVADEPTLRGMGSVHKAVVGMQENAARAQRGSRPLRDASDRKPAAEQIKAARERAQERRTRASKRIHTNRKNRKSYANTPGAAVVFAGLLGLAVLGGGTVLGLAMFTTTFYDHSTIIAPSPPEIPTGTAQVAAHPDGVSVSDQSPTPPADLSGLKMVDAKVLMVPMLPQPIEPELLSELEIGLDSLRSQGLEIAGDLAGSDTDDTLIEQTAKLRNTIGSVPVDSIQFPMHIQKWLTNSSFDGVLIFASDPNDPDIAQVMLVMDQFHTTLPVSDRAVHDLLAVLDKNGYAQD